MRGRDYNIFEPMVVLSKTLTNKNRESMRRKRKKKMKKVETIRISNIYIYQLSLQWISLCKMQHISWRVKIANQATKSNALLMLVDHSFLVKILDSWSLSNCEYETVMKAIDFLRTSTYSILHLLSGIHRSQGCSFHSPFRY